MMVETRYETTVVLLNEIYDQTKKHNDDFKGAEVVCDYFGDINEQSISKIASDVEHQLQMRLEHKTISKRIFSIYIEGLQNIFKHGCENPEGKHLGATLLVKTEKSYRIHFLNVSPTSEIAPMSEYLDYLNSLSLDDTKKFYIDRLVNGQISARGGASLGYIIMKLKSSNNITYNFKYVNDDCSCYQVEIVLDFQIEK